MQKIYKRVVVVTGGSSGIGKAIAKELSDDSQVVILGRDQGKLQQAAAELNANVAWYQLNVGQRNEVEIVVHSILQQFQHIDVLVNCAGFLHGVTTTMDLSEAEVLWDEVLNANLKGSFLMAAAVASYLPRPGGRIINISSIAAFTGGSRAGTLAYSAAKAGIHGLTYGLARELSHEGVTVNAVAPGYIESTGFTGGWSQEKITGTVAQIPLGRPGTVEDVASAVRYLASKEAAFITGEVLNVNGGWLFGR